MITFREVEISDAKMILDWRTKDRITAVMSTDVAYDLATQERWIVNNFKKPDYYHWIVQYDARDVGLINFANYRPEKNETSWGYYVGVDDAKGIGRDIPPLFFNFAFDKLGVASISAEVVYSNTRVIDLYLDFGFEFEPARDHVVDKNGDSILMVCLRLQKNTFKNSELSGLKTTLPLTKWAHRKQVHSHD